MSDILGGKYGIGVTQGLKKTMSDQRDIRIEIEKGEVLESPAHPSHLSEEDVAFETGMLGREINGRFQILKVCFQIRNSGAESGRTLQNGHLKGSEPFKWPLSSPN